MEVTNLMTGESIKTFSSYDEVGDCFYVLAQFRNTNLYEVHLRLTPEMYLQTLQPKPSKFFCWLQSFFN